MINMFNVESSNMAAIGYDADKEILHVKFKNDRSYIYKEVPPHEFVGIMTAESHGKYLNSNIKGVYDYEESNPQN